MILVQNLMFIAAEVLCCILQYHLISPELAALLKSFCILCRFAQIILYSLHKAFITVAVL
jgi:hypothetical protein